jgi:dipeptidyl aminopeptidase/acylaminoacyl peptidase
MTAELMFPNKIGGTVVLLHEVFPVDGYKVLRTQLRRAAVITAPAFIRKSVEAKLYDNGLSVLRNFIAFVCIPLLLSGQEVVAFHSGDLILRGVLYRPNGAGPFPAIVYNHGSAPDNSAASDALGPLFVKRGWVFFMPSRRGQGLSVSAGPYIRDEIAAAIKKGGIRGGATTMVRLLETDHLNDQLAALAWLRANRIVQSSRIAVAGNSFGGIETVLGAEKGSYCAGIDSSGGA